MQVNYVDHKPIAIKDLNLGDVFYFEGSDGGPYIVVVMRSERMILDVTTWDVLGCTPEDIVERVSATLTIERNA